MLSQPDEILGQLQQLIKANTNMFVFGKNCYDIILVFHILTKPD
jgi:hypothetical protein